MGKEISVVVASHNRPNDVRDVLNSLLNQSRPPTEVILIDDASNPQLELDYRNKKRARFKLIRFDKNMGASIARNYGIKSSKSEFVAFIDVDAIADKYWLEEIQKGFNRGADVIGGRIESLYLAEPPTWWDEKYFGAFIAVGNKDNIIWGANMAIRKSIIHKVGYFNTKLGPRGGKKLGGEDVDFLNRARKMKCRVLFIPKARVFHKVPSKRLTLRYILKWSYYWGKTERITMKNQLLKSTILSLVKSLFLFWFRFFSRSIPRKVLELAWIMKNLSYLTPF